MLNTPEGAKERRFNWRRALVVALAVWAILVGTLVLIATWKVPAHRAVIVMAWGLMLLWIGLAGFVMWNWRHSWDLLLQRMRLPWMLRFVIACTVLALIEEAITTAMTNSAPYLGVNLGEAYITASANYLDVVLYHSVVVFVPLFIGWSVLLRFWSFSPFAVFLLFGITGTLCETISFGPQNLANFGMWSFVYGLMVWLPARSVPPERGARPPRWWAYPLAVFFPFLFMPLLFLIAPWLWLTARHPTIHFPPIGG